MPGVYLQKKDLLNGNDILSADQECQDHKDTKGNPIPAEDFEVMLLDIAHQKTDDENGDQESNDASGQ